MKGASLIGGCQASNLEENTVNANNIGLTQPSDRPVIGSSGMIRETVRAPGALVRAYKPFSCLRRPEKGKEEYYER